MNKQGIGLWVVVCALLVLDIGVHCVRAQNGAANVMKVQELQILDSQGHVAIDLTAQQDKSGVFLYDAKGRERVKLVADNAGGRLTLADENTHPQLMLDGSPNPSVTLRQNDNLRMAMQTFSNDDASFQIFNDNGGERVYLGYRPSADVSDSLLCLHTDEPSNRDVRMDISAINASIGIDGSKAQMVEMNWDETDAPAFCLFDKKHDLVWSRSEPDKNGTLGYLLPDPNWTNYVYPKDHM